MNELADKSYESIEWVPECREILKEKIAELGLPNNSGEFAENLIQDFILNYIFSYLKGNMGETRQEAFDCYNKAIEIADELQLDETKRPDAYKPYKERMEILDRELLEKLTKWVEENIGTTEDEAHNCRNDLTKQIEEEKLDPEKAADIYKTIDDRLKKRNMVIRNMEKNAAEYLKSDDAAEKMNFLKS